MQIRRAEEKDIDGIIRLLHQVLEVHASSYPDIFKTGTTKYTPDDLRKMLGDGSQPVFVAEEDGEILGHAFTVVQEQPETVNTYPERVLYIDDICVDEKARKRHIGTELFKYVKSYAVNDGFSRITLNVWEKNKAAEKFYEALGMERLKSMMHMKL